MTTAPRSFVFYKTVTCFIHLHWLKRSNYSTADLNDLRQNQVMDNTNFKKTIFLIKHRCPLNHRVKQSFRTSHHRCSERKGVLRNFTKFTVKHLCQSLFFNKVPFLKKRLWHRCFPVNCVKFLRTPFCTEHLWVTASRVYVIYAASVNFKKKTEDTERTICAAKQTKLRFPIESQHETSFMLVLFSSAYVLFFYFIWKANKQNTTLRSH